MTHHRLWECKTCSNFDTTDHPCTLPPGWTQDNQGDGEYCSECWARFCTSLRIYCARTKQGYGYEYEWESIPHCA